MVNGGGTRVWLENEEGVDPEGIAEVYGRMKGEYSLGIETRLGDKSRIERLVGVGDSVRVRCDGDAKSNGEDKLNSKLVISLCTRRARVVLASNDAEMMRLVARGSDTHKRSLMFEVPLGCSTRSLNGLAKGRNALSLYVPYGKDWAPYIVNRLAGGGRRGIAARLLGNLSDEINGKSE